MNYANRTAESMFQTFWGFPSTPAFSNTSGSWRPDFNVDLLSRFCSLPYIFHNAGYTWEHVQSPALDGFRKALENEKVSFEYLDELKKGSFKSRDQYIFKYVWDLFQIKEREKKGPFVISLSTIDSHYPNGFVDENTLEYPNKSDFPDDFEYIQLLNAIYTTDHYLGVLIDNILSSSIGKDTVIAIINDHTFMGNINNIISKKERKNLFMILNAGERIERAEKGTHLDIAPTILDFFKIRSNYVFPCGESLLDFPTKEYTLRTLDSARRKELNKLAALKKSQKQTNTISINKQNPKYLNLFGLDVPHEIWRGVFAVFLSDDNSPINSYTYEDENASQFLGTCLNNNESNTVILFQVGLHPVIEKSLFEKLHISQPILAPTKYGLVYRSNQKQFISIFADNLNDLSINFDQYKNLKDKSIVEFIQQPTSNMFHYLVVLDAKDAKYVDNCIIVDGLFPMVLAKKTTMVGDNNQIYFSCNIKNTGKVSTRVYGGFATYDDNNTVQRSDLDKGSLVVEGKSGERAILVQGENLKISNNCNLYLVVYSSNIPIFHLLSQQIDSVSSGAIAVPAHIKSFDPTKSITKIILTEPLQNDIAKDSIVSVVPPIGAYMFCEDVVLEPGQERVFNCSTSCKGPTLVKPLIMSHSVDGKTENTISISDFSIINF